MRRTTTTTAQGATAGRVVNSAREADAGCSLIAVLVHLCLLIVFVPSARSEDTETRPRGASIVRHTLVVEGRERSYDLAVPSAKQRLEEEPERLLIVLHGGGGNAENARRMSEVLPYATSRGFLVAFPNGTGFFQKKLLTWNSWNCCGYAQRNRVDDIAFVRAMVKDVRASTPYPVRRVFVTGMSNGAMMAYRAACDAGDIVDGIAPVAGALNGTCAPARAVAVLIFHGTMDQHVPYNGGIGAKAREHREDNSVEHAFHFWKERNGCAGETIDTVTPSITRASGTGCEQPVSLYTLKGEGHTWPGGTPGLRFGNVDRPAQEISATRVIVDFFRSL